MQPLAQSRSSRLQLPSYLPLAGAVLLLLLLVVAVAMTRGHGGADPAGHPGNALAMAGCEQVETCVDLQQAGYRLIADGSFDLTRRLLPCRRAPCPYPAILRPHEHDDVTRMRASVGFLEARSSYTFNNVVLAATTPAALRDSLRRIVEKPGYIAVVEGEAWRGGSDGTTVVVYAHTVVAQADRK